MTEENKDQSGKAMLAVLGFASMVELSARLGLLGKCEQLTGKSGDEALGVLQAWKQSHDELATAQASLAQLQASDAAGKLDAAIAQAKADKRWTPAREEKMRKLLADKEVSQAGALALCAEWGKIAEPGTAAAQVVRSADGELKHNGKTYAEMLPMERHNLKRDNRELYDLMQADAQARGLI